MTLELNGKITTGGEWDVLYIGDESLVEFASEVDERKIKLRYYISNSPINKETVVEDFLRSFYEGLSETDGTYCCGSSWTGVYSQNDIFQVGGHNIIKELSEHLGKYCYLIIETE